MLLACAGHGLCIAVRSAPDAALSPVSVCVYAVGSADFYPVTSGKCAAARYLMSRFSAEAQHCAFLCDDDNDMVSDDSSSLKTTIHIATCRHHMYVSHVRVSHASGWGKEGRLLDLLGPVLRAGASCDRRQGVSPNCFFSTSKSFTLSLRPRACA